MRKRKGIEDEKENFGTSTKYVRNSLKSKTEEINKKFLC